MKPFPRLLSIPHVRGRGSRRPVKPAHLRCRPRLESLETRIVPSVSVSGVPAWVEQGPGPILFGQTEQLNRDLTHPLGTNPIAGAIRAVAPHPIDPNIIYVGTADGGVWKTTNAYDAGLAPTWTPLTDTLPSLSVGAVAFSPLEIDPLGNTVFVGTGRFSSFGGAGGPAVGIYKTTDAGASWSILGQAELGGKNISEIIPTRVIDSATLKQVVLVGTDGGLFRSVTAGTSWENVSTDTNLTDTVGTGLPAGKVKDLVSDPADPKRFYAAVSGAGLFRSGDTGKTWVTVNGTASMTSLVTAATNLKLSVSRTPTGATGLDPVYVGIVAKDSSGDESNDRLAGVFRSNNLGATWVAMSVPVTTETPPGGPKSVGIHPGGQGDLHFSLAADPDDPFGVYIGGDRQPLGLAGEAGLPTNSIGALDFSGRLFRGDFLKPFGQEWEPVTHIGAATTAPHADSRDMAFDVNGNLLEADDGGVFRLVHPEGSLNPLDLRHWQSINGNLRITELLSVAYDSLNDVVFGGAQDVGVSEQQSASGRTWATVQEVFGLVKQEGDGNTVAADTSSPASTIRYTMGNSLGTFLRREFIPGNVLANQLSLPVLLSAKTEPPIPFSGLNEADSMLVTETELNIHYVLNSIDPKRMLLGVNGLYETVGPSMGDVITEIDARLPAPASQVSALAYGGRNADGTPNAGVIYAARGNELAVRSGPAAPFTHRLVGPAGSTIVDIVLDPGDWRTAYLISNSGRVFRLAGAATNDAEIAGETLTDITGNLAVPRLSTIELFRSAAGQRVVLVGTAQGVFRTLDSDDKNAAAFWDRFGAGLPNVTVTDLHYDPTDRKLILATLGRGAWTMTGADAELLKQGVLEVTGGSGNDTIRLVRHAGLPSQLDVFENNTSGTPTFTVPLASLGEVRVRGLGGSDTLIVDSQNGGIVLPGGVTYDGGSAAEDNRLFLEGGTASASGYAIGTQSAAGKSTLTFAEGSQVVSFTNLATAAGTLRDRVQSPKLIVTADNSANTIRLDDGTLFSSRLQVAILTPAAGLTFAPIEFENKAELVINADSSFSVFGGADQIQLLNTHAATGLTAVTVNGLAGNNTFTVEATSVPTQVTGGGGDDVFNVGDAGVFNLRSGFSLASIDAALTILGGLATTAITTSLGADILNIRHTGGDPSSGLSGQLSYSPATDRHTLTGLEMAAAGITYGSIPSVNILLGGGSDTFTILGTRAGVATTLETGGGGDTINVRAIGGSTTVNAGDGSDLIRVGSRAPLLGGTVNAIIARLTVLGGPNGSTGDRLVVDDSNETANSSVTVSTKAVTGLGMPLGILYQELERISIFTGSGNDTLTLDPSKGVGIPVDFDPGKGQNDGVIINGTAGNDDIRIGRRVGPDGPELVTRINGHVSVIGYRNGETITVLAGAGNDRVVMDDSAGATWRAAFRGGAGNDRLVGSLKGDTLDGGPGNDRLEGGGGADVLIGGPGRDTFITGAGADQVFAADGGQDSIFADLEDLLRSFDPRDRIVRRKPS